MKRREALSGACGVGFLAVSGCLRTLDLGDTCPDPEIDQELSYESYHDGWGAGRIDGNIGTTIMLATTTAELDPYDSGEISDGLRTWIEETDFDESVVVGVRLGSHMDSTTPRTLGVEREPDGAIRVYTCIRDTEIGPARHYGKIFRIHHGGSPPSVAHLSFWHSDEWSSYSSQ